jgi:hypothetical protein
VGQLSLIDIMLISIFIVTSSHSYIIEIFLGSAICVNCSKEIDTNEFKFIKLNTQKTKIYFKYKKEQEISIKINTLNFDDFN